MAQISTSSDPDIPVSTDMDQLPIYPVIYKTSLHELIVLTHSIQHELEKMTWSIDHLIHLVTHMIQLVETIKNIKGQAKQDLAIDLLHYSVQRFSQLPIETEAKFHRIIDSMAPSMIHTIIMASKGQLHLNLKPCDPSLCCFSSSSSSLTSS